MPGPLNDIRVVDFTHALNGPFCTMLLGHLVGRGHQDRAAPGRQLPALVDGA